MGVGGLFLPVRLSDVFNQGMFKLGAKSLSLKVKRIEWEHFFFFFKCIVLKQVR